MGASLQNLLKRDRAVVALALVSSVILAWGYILTGAGTGMPALEMSGLPTAAGAMEGMQPVAWTIGYGLLMLVMWWLMMVAMMLPSAAPMILLYATLMRKQRQAEATRIPTAAFSAGYLVVWATFGALAVLLQWTLEQAALLSPAMVVTSMAVGALLLIGAGIWQLTPLKYTCLRNCRSPLQFVARHWRPGNLGALRMGVDHGAYCVGCCWMLMLLLFYGGIMNIYWIAALATLVLIEKMAPAGHWVSTLVGIGLICWGGTLLAGLW